MPFERDGVQIVPGDGPEAAAVGAPFDPCRTVGWADVPAVARPDTKNLPRMMEVRPGDGFATGCQFNNSGEATIRICRPACDDGAPDYTLGPTYLVNIVWGTHMSTDPTDYGPSTTVEKVAGRRMLITSDRSHIGGVQEPRCTATFALARGVAGVAVIDGRFGTDPCTSARALARTIATRAAGR